MSGRTPVTLSDGRRVTGFRKTLRRNPRRADLGRDIIGPAAPNKSETSSEYPVTLTFLLPKTILVSPGPHGFNTQILPNGEVKIVGRSADHCTNLARALFGAIARERPGFSVKATYRYQNDPLDKQYVRWLTVIKGDLSLK
jgi:hypothetical protein